jgi:hypothetical protein
MRREWFCHGCKKQHRMDRYIEGTAGPAEYWCAHSIQRAIREGRNYRPTSITFTLPTSPKGNENVISPGR